jgi:uncharacterized protein YqeY
MEELMPLKDQLMSDLNTAMKAKDKIRVDTVRMIRARIQEAEIAAKKGLDEGELATVLSRYGKQLRESIEGFAQADRLEQKTHAEAELKILESYLPQQLSDAEVAEFVQKAIAQAGATSAKDMGAVMALVMPQVKGRADGKNVNQAVKSFLEKAQ